MNTQTKAHSQNNSGQFLRDLSIKLLGHNTGNWSVLFIAGGVGLLMVLPAVYIVIKALGANPAVWSKLFSTSIPSLLLSTIGLTVFVTILTILIAVPASWLVTMTDLPGRKTWQWLFAVPLAIPPYIGSFAYITLLGPRGLVQQQLSALLGVAPHQLNIPSIYSFGGTLIIMSLFTYPYIFLLTSAALRSQNQSLIDAAKASGMGMKRVLGRVVLPLARPAIAAGSLLVALYVLSDFGAISLLRYSTFTSAIYQQLTGRYDLSAAASLSSVLMILTMIVIWFEFRSRSKAKYYQTSGSYRPPILTELGKWKWAAMAFIFVIFAAALILPISVLIYWAYVGLSEGALDLDFWQYAINSVTTSGIAATAGVFLALPVVYLAARNKSLISRFLLRISYAGYALPGVLVGLGVVFVFNAGVPLLYGTVAVLILGYVVRFLPQSLQSEESALSTISPNIEEAAKNFGYSTHGVLRRVTVPLILPAMAASWALIFISSMKELAATLLLRPVGFDTLAIRIWTDASEGSYTAAAPPALLLVLVSTIPLAIITRRAQIGGRKSRTMGEIENAGSTT